MIALIAFLAVFVGVPCIFIGGCLGVAAETLTEKRKRS